MDDISSLRPKGLLFQYSASGLKSDDKFQQKHSNNNLKIRSNLKKLYSLKKQPSWHFTLRLLHKVKSISINIGLIDMESKSHEFELILV